MNKLILLSFIVCGVLGFESVSASNDLDLLEYKAVFDKKVETIELFVTTNIAANCRYKLEHKLGNQDLSWDWMTDFFITGETEHTSKMEWYDESYAYILCRPVDKRETQVGSIIIALDPNDEITKKVEPKKERPDNSIEKVDEQAQQIKLLNQQVELLNAIIKVLMARLAMVN
jgi:hypothetical protein